MKSRLNRNSPTAGLLVAPDVAPAETLRECVGVRPASTRRAVAHLAKLGLVRRVDGDCGARSNVVPLIV
jgi:hypothetical protein